MKRVLHIRQLSKTIIDSLSQVQVKLQEINELHGTIESQKLTTFIQKSELWWSLY